MQLATIRTGGATSAVRVDGDELVETGWSDVGSLLMAPDWRGRAAEASGTRHSIDGADFAPLIPHPDKVICVGLNYRDHIAETGREAPEFPALFAKYSSSLIGAHDDIVLPAVSDMVDWEAELAVVIGAPVRHASGEVAAEAVAGFTVLNDISVRDWQRRTNEWLQGKTFEATTPIGPYLVVREAGESPDLDREIVCEVDGDPRQKSSTGSVVFPPSELVAYISTIITLQPGDVISTGTPGGVGAARTPPLFLRDGETVVTRISGVGELRNVCRKEPAPS